MISAKNYLYQYKTTGMALASQGHLLFSGREVSMRLWGKIVKDGRVLRDIVIENNKEDTRTHKVMDALNDICYQFDLSRPIWLDANITQFQRHKKTQFKQDSFIEAIEFDFLEISVLEEDFSYPA